MNRATGLLVALVFLAQTARLQAQTPAYDPSSRLSEVLPAAVVDQVLQRIADARALQLPAAAIEHRALELAAKRVDPQLISADAGRTLDHLAAGRAALANGGAQQPTDGEIEAAGTALGKGVDGAQVSELARSAPSGRDLTVPLFVISSLVDRGLPSDAALAQVLQRLTERASDAELAQMGNRPDWAGTGRPDVTGTDLAATKRPASAGRPASVPNGMGSGMRPDLPVMPAHPGGRP